MNALEITSDQLRDLLRKDPDWIGTHATAETPVVVTDHCNLTRSPIRRLSPHITFAGTNAVGQAAWFTQCKDLENAEGVFHGSVDFDESGVREIGQLRVLKSPPGYHAATFQHCPNLTILRGDFNGSVSCDHAPNLKKIDVENLILRKPNEKGWAGRFYNCKGLEVAEGTFPGRVDFNSSGIHKIGDLKIIMATPTKENDAVADFSICQNLTVATGHFPGYAEFGGSKVNRVHNLTSDIPTGKYIAGFFGCLDLLECPLEVLPFLHVDHTQQRRIETHMKNTEKARHTLRSRNQETHLEL